MAQLAQLNVARLRHPLEHADLQPFVESLDAVNAVADTAPGFVWRLQEETGNATGIRPWGEDMIVNLSVWEDLPALESYVYGTAHASVLRQRRMFFSPLGAPSVVLWWVADGRRPSLEEARERLDRLEAEGPTAYAFTMREPFPAEDADISDATGQAGPADPA
jgi:hypothetical protein